VSPYTYEPLNTVDTCPRRHQCQYSGSEVDQDAGWVALVSTSLPQLIQPWTTHRHITHSIRCVMGVSMFWNLKRPRLVWAEFVGIQLHTYHTPHVSMWPLSKNVGSRAPNPLMDVPITRGTVQPLKLGIG